MLGHGVGPPEAIGVVPRLESLTGLRFWAALLVFAIHADLVTGLPGWLDPVSFGFVGVSFFFVLSGFVLAWSRRPGETTRLFWWHRFARIWPLHALITVTAVAFGLSSAPDSALWTNLGLVHGLLPGRFDSVGANPPSWSISTEAFFYAAFPLLVAWVMAGRVHDPRRVALLGAILAPAALVPIVVGPWTPLDFLGPKFVPLRLAEFTLGIALAAAMVRDWRPRLTVRGATALVAAVYLIEWKLGLAAWISNLLIAPAFGLLISAAAARDLNGHRNRAWLTTLGRWSFAVYLIHYPVLIAVERTGATGLPALVAALALTIPLSGALYAGFERPVERWLRGLRRGRALVAAPNPAAS